MAVVCRWCDVLATANGQQVEIGVPESARGFRSGYTGAGLVLGHHRHVRHRQENVLIQIDPIHSWVDIKYGNCSVDYGLI